MRTSCINHPARDPFIIVRKWQVDLLEGDRTAAALLSFFEFRHNDKLDQKEKALQENDVAEAHGDSRTQDETLYQWHTEKELEDAILISKRDAISAAIKKLVEKELEDAILISKRDAISAAIKKLVEKGFLSVHKNPNPKYKFDKTRYFLFYPETVNKAIESRSSINPSSSRENPSRQAENPAQSRDFRGAISKKSSKKSSKEENKEEAGKEFEIFSFDEKSLEQEATELELDSIKEALLIPPAVDKQHNHPLPINPQNLVVDHYSATWPSGVNNFENNFKTSIAHPTHIYPEAKALAEMGLAALWVGPNRSDYAPALLAGVKAKKQALNQLVTNGALCTYIANRINLHRRGEVGHDSDLQRLYEDGQTILGIAQGNLPKDVDPIISEEGWVEAELALLSEPLSTVQRLLPQELQDGLMKSKFEKIALLKTNPSKYKEHAL
jgi:hypothetical protein